MRRLALLAAVSLALALAGCGSQGVVAPTAQTVVGTLPTAAPVAKGDPAAGKKLYAANGCGGCHTFKPAGSAGQVRPRLGKIPADAPKAEPGPLRQDPVQAIHKPK